MTDVQTLLLAFIAVTVAILVVYGLRDGILAWWLIHKLIGSPQAPTTPSQPPSPPIPPIVPKPDPPPIPPIPPIPPVQPPPPPPTGKPRFIGDTGTSFAGSNDSITSRTGAYDGKLINGDTELAVALPGKVTPNRLVRAFYKGNSAVGPVRDKGPWNTNDRYWETGSRPLAETQYVEKIRASNGMVPSNPAGIDLTPAFWRALGYTGNPQEAQDKIDWDFEDVLTAGSNTPGTSAVPAHLALMRQLRDEGIDAGRHSDIILSWPGKIAAKYPQMAQYCNGYTDVSTPWCGLALAYVLSETGIMPIFGAMDTDRFLWALSWLQFGTAVVIPQPGDIMIYVWDIGGHHVSIYDHEVSDAYYHCTGGNQGSGHVISTESMPMHNCVGIRRLIHTG